MNTNVNFIWTTVFVKRLEKLGVKQVCVSPGSRNTPLILAFAKSKKIKSHVFVDERQASFFALGMAKKSSLPVAIVTTSGTATAEVYPAIIEAYQTCTPLIICTADRPEYLRNSGANQTINQENIYSNHINFFYNLKLPKLTDKRLTKLIKVTDKAFSIALSKGPVHLNFPFEKPLEPWNFNSVFDLSKIEKYVNLPIDMPEEKENKDKIHKQVLNKIKTSEKILFLLGGNLSVKKSNEVLKLSKFLNVPVIADGTNGARFSSENTNVITYASSFLRHYSENLFPDLIISFGKAPTTNTILDFYKKSKAFKILINERKRIQDPSLTFNILLDTDFKFFINELKKNDYRKDKSFLRDYLFAEKESSDLANITFGKNDFLFEGNIVRSLVNVLPVNSTIFIANSTLPRDFDFFSDKPNKNFNVFTNRGASGIDGIIATAGGIAKLSKKRIYLYIGDLSFYYDIGFLYYLKSMKIPLTIILQNNSGGGIFELLPISREKKYFTRYFKTEINVDFKMISEAYNIRHFSAKKISDFNEIINEFVNENESPIIIEIKTDAKYSAKKREKFFNDIGKIFHEMKRSGEADI